MSKSEKSEDCSLIVWNVLGSLVDKRETREKALHLRLLNAGIFHDLENFEKHLDQDVDRLLELEPKGDAILRSGAARLTSSTALRDLRKCDSKIERLDEDLTLLDPIDGFDDEIKLRFSAPI